VSTVEVSNTPATTVGSGDAPIVVVAQDNVETIFVSEQGPPGAQGPAGTPGPPGEPSTIPGPAGPQGNTVLYGVGNPLSGVGVNGDFYINTTTHFIFGPKSSGAWPAGTSLVGPQGATGATGATGPTGSTGAPGNTVLYGTSNPTAGVGVDGNFYINTSTNFLYGPKAAGAWPAGTSLVGPQGPQGIQGIQGIQGPQGNPGSGSPGSSTPLMDGTATVGVSTLFARDDHRHPTDTSRAPLASPTFTGDPKAPTASVGDNDTSIATTAFVQAAIAAAVAGSMSPQGRLTIASGVPVMLPANNVGLAATVYYTPYKGLIVPLWNGTTLVPVSTGGELSQALSDTSKSPAAAVASKNYDYFVWLDGSTMRCTRGPPWSTDTARGTGAGTTEITRSVGGILTNAVAITNGPAANRGTYVGTIRTNSAGTIDFQYGLAGAAGGQPIILSIFNAHNRVNIKATTKDSTVSYTPPAGTRAMNGSNSNRIQWLRGLDEDAWLFSNSIRCTPSASSNIQMGFGHDGIGLTAAGAVTPVATVVADFQLECHITAPGLGWHFSQVCEQVVGTNTVFCAIYHLIVADVMI
jgi:hypothetical protein